jgi:4-hydroxymandelate oxidase
MLTVADVHEAAMAVLPAGARDFLDGGAGDEFTLRANETAFDAFQLKPRVLRDVSAVDTSAQVLGARVAFPILLGPAGAHRLFHPDGERAYARAAADLGTGLVLSTSSSVSLEEVASVAPALRWFQVYCYRERDITRALMERARDAGYTAICLTVDAPRHGRRLRNLRNGYSIPAEIPRANFADVTENVSGRSSDLGTYIRENYDASLTWDDIDWFASVSGLPIVLKGILDPEDAVLAAEAGAAGIVVSNHGGRQLDGTPTAISVLAEIVEAAGDRLEVYLDGGIRTGGDAVKAIAVGARAVLIARPYLWGLTVGGQAGVRHVLQLLRSDFELTMTLMGARSLSELTPRSVSIRR